MICIDIPIPKNCLVCPMCNEYLMCGIPCNGKGWGETDVHEYDHNRPEWCPMKEREEIVRCKDCRFAHMTYDGLCKQCDNATDDDDIKLTLYLPGDFYCAFGKRKGGDGE